jgi:hypothetical protein
MSTRQPIPTATWTVIEDPSAPGITEDEFLDALANYLLDLYDLEHGSGGQGDPGRLKCPTLKPGNGT